jgi:hypothetical protein
MVKRKKPKAAGDQLTELVVDVASGDMPTETVIRADKGKNPVADALRQMGKSKARRLAPREASAAARLRASTERGKAQGRDVARGAPPRCLIIPRPATALPPVIHAPRSTRDAPCQPRLSAW